MGANARVTIGLGEKLEILRFELIRLNNILRNLSEQRSNHVSSTAVSENWVDCINTDIGTMDLLTCCRRLPTEGDASG